MNFCRKQVSGIPFDLLGIELKSPPNSHCYGCFHQNKLYPHLSQILTVGLPYTMYIDDKSARCWNYSPENSQIHFPPGSTFQSNRQAVSTDLSFINTLCTLSEKNFPIQMENKKHIILRFLGEELDSILLMDWIERNLNTRFEAPMN